jgi:ferredoxin
VVKEDLLDELQSQVDEQHVEITPGRAERIERKSGRLLVHVAGEGALSAKRVIVAIGRTGNFRKLNVPGEGLEKVSNRLIDPRGFSGKRVLVVGGGDSALEAAITLADEGAQVDLSYRKKEFARPKPDNVSCLQRLEESGRLRLHLGTNVQEISEESVTICGESGRDETLPNDQVFVLIGREPPLDFFRRSGIPISGDRDPKFWATIAFALLFCIWLYHWKSYGGALPLGIQFPSWLNPQPADWVAGLGGWWSQVGTLGNALKTSAAQPGFFYSLAYCLIVLVFGVRRIQRRKTPYVARQTVTLMMIQWIPLFILPYILFPWMGANGAFTSGGFGQWFGEAFLSDGPGTEPTAYWRAFGFVLAWPLFVFNLFTDQPIWGWLVLGLIQTFVIIPIIVWRWGKGAYCGWICSCGALAETLGDAHRQKMPHGPRSNRFNLIGQAILALALALFAIRILGWLFPDSFIGSAFWGLLSGIPLLNYQYLVDLWLAGILGVAFYFHLSGRVWCRFSCPLAALMHIYARFSRFRIFANKDKCISCNVCTSVCHQGIDVMAFASRGRPMEDPQCVRCSACVQSCPTGVLSFGHFNGQGQPIHDRLPASSVQIRELRGGA